MAGERGQRERAARGLGGLIGRDLVLGVEHHHRGAVGQLLQAAAVGSDRVPQRVLERRVVPGGGAQHHDGQQPALAGGRRARA
ncbi:MAG TPA: hypothetical protein VF516_35530, partial [Kofleriaceae bacterium]